MLLFIIQLYKLLGDLNMFNVFLFILLAFLWGSSFLVVKDVVHQIDPLFGAFLRGFIALIFFSILYLVRRKSVRVAKKDLWKPWVLGLLLMGFPFVVAFWGQKYVPAGLGGIFNSTVPIWTFIMGSILLKGQDKFSWTRASGVFLGICGVLLIFTPKFMAGAADNLALLGAGALLMMAVFYAMGNVMIKYVLNTTPTLTIEGNIFQQHIMGSAFLFLFFLSFGGTVGAEVLNAKIIMANVYIAVFCSAIALLIMFRLIHQWGALRFSMVTYLVPIVAITLDLLLNGVVPNKYEIFGMLIIFASLFLVERNLSS
jgi:drug/metabolite transporter (DMT)-like permease